MTGVWTAERPKWGGPAAGGERRTVAEGPATGFPVSRRREVRRMEIEALLETFVWPPDIVDPVSMGGGRIADVVID